MPMPKARKPSGTTLPYGRTTTRTCGWMATRGCGYRRASLRNRGQTRRAAGEAALLEVVLVVVLRLPERRRILDLRHDRLRAARLDALARCLRRGALGVVVDEDHGAVLIADVRPLPVQLGRVVLGPERREERLVRDHVLVVGHLDDLGVTGVRVADLLVGRAV